MLLFNEQKRRVITYFIKHKENKKDCKPKNGNTNKNKYNFLHKRSKTLCRDERIVLKNKFRKKQHKKSEIVPEKNYNNENSINSIYTLNHIHINIVLMN